MSEMQLMEYDFDDVDDVKPTVPDVQPARGSRKHKNKKSSTTDVHIPNNSAPAPSAPISTTPDVMTPNHAQPSSAAPSVPSVLEQVTAAFDVLPDFINDTDAITKMLTTLLPLKKGSAAVVTGLAAAIIAYYCLSVKEE